MVCLICFYLNDTVNANAFEQVCFFMIAINLISELLKKGFQALCYIFVNNNVYSRLYLIFPALIFLFLSILPLAFRVVFVFLLPLILGCLRMGFIIYPRQTQSTLYPPQTSLNLRSILFIQPPKCQGYRQIIPYPTYATYFQF